MLLFPYIKIYIKKKNFEIDDFTEKNIHVIFIMPPIILLITWFQIEYQDKKYNCFQLFVGERL